jgi:hypothetical protein
VGGGRHAADARAESVVAMRRDLLALSGEAGWKRGDLSPRAGCGCLGSKAWTSMAGSTDRGAVAGAGSCATEAGGTEICGPDPVDSPCWAYSPSPARLSMTTAVKTSRCMLESD